MNSVFIVSSTTKIVLQQYVLQLHTLMICYVYNMNKEFINKLYFMNMGLDGEKKNHYMHL